MSGTKYGPTTSFRDLVRTVVMDTNEFFSVAAPIKFKKLPEPVFSVFLVNLKVQLVHQYTTIFPQKKRRV
jgi:hypothetical protein